MIHALTFAQGKKLLDTCKNAVLLDVRTEEEYTVEHASGAISLPLDDLNDMEEGEVARILPDKNAPLVLYCRTGRRSALAASRLTDLGYTRLYDLGGLNGWSYGMSYGMDP